MEDLEQDMFGWEDVDDNGQVVSTPEEPQVEDSDVSYEDSDFEGHGGNEVVSDYVTTLLKEKGIDRDNIQVFDEDNNQTSVKFDDLTDEQKADILRGEAVGPQLSDAEIETLNYLRSNNMSLQDFADWQKKQALDEYMANQQPTSEIDSYSDDEIVAYDLIKRFGDEMTDEEIDAEIDRLKSDENAYAKRVALLRNSYKSEAEAQAKLYADQQTQQQKEFTDSFVNAYYNAANDLNDIQGITLDNQDKSELLDFVLNKDAADKTAFYKALDDPNAVLKMAWFLLHGEEAFNQTVDYFKGEIAKREKGTPRAVTRQRVSTPKSAFSI